MRLIGAGERGLEAMVDRCQQRVAFKRALVDHGSVRHQIAESRLALNGARLLVLQAAWELDQKGNKAARDAIAMAKVRVLDMSVQVSGTGFRFQVSDFRCEDGDRTVMHVGIDSSGWYECRYGEGCG